MAGKWKHGYIPEDMQAALEKAHGSKTGASKALTAGKRSGPAKPRTAPKKKTATRAMPASQRQGLRGIKPAPTPKTAPKVKTQAQKQVSNLSASLTKAGFGPAKGKTGRSK